MKEYGTEFMDRVRRETLERTGVTDFNVMKRLHWIGEKGVKED